MNDIDMTGVSDFEPISLSGTFDGNNKKISNLTIESSSISANASNAIGLFWKIDGGTVKNLELNNIKINADVDDGFNEVGFVVGDLTCYSGQGSVENVKVTGNSVIEIFRTRR